MPGYFVTIPCTERPQIKPLVRILEDVPMLWIDTLGDRMAVDSTVALILSTLATVGLGMTVLG